ncbi:MAG: preprotein translocase subunit YajC [Planctomycetota bacterium]|jgi:preprotein translocase subunit YajC
MAMSILTIWLPIGFLFWFLLIRPQSQERKRRQAMLDAVKKNDHVITIGGIYGVVTDVRREANKITIRIDETSNLKIRVTFGSIAQIVVRDESSGDSSSS